MQKNIVITLLVVLLVISVVAFVMVTWSGQSAPRVDQPVVVVPPADQVVPEPTKPADVGDAPVVVQKNIQVFYPQPNANIVSPYIASGKAKGWYFEGSFPVKLLDSNNKVLATGQATAQGDWMVNEFVSFSAQLIFNPGKVKSGKLVFMKDNPSGLPQYDESFDVPVNFAVNNKITVQNFFTNAKEDPQFLDCSKLFYVKREVLPTLAVGTAALVELLKGPTAAEKALGFGTAINPGVTINSLTIENGVAKVDFDGGLEKGVGGSCKTTTIRAQIEQTLRQFPTVTKVIISIDGKSGDQILQP